MLVLLLLSLISLTQTTPLYIKNKNDVDKKPFTINDFLRGGNIHFKSFNGTWITDEEVVYRLNGNLVKYNVRTDAASIFLPASAFTDIRAYDFQISPNLKQVLFKYDSRRVFRRSSVAKYAIYDIESKNYQYIAGKESLQFCIWSPLGNRIAYVLANNVFLRNSNGTEIQLTHDGKDGVIYNGIADWVYEEEVFASPQAIWFSPDDKKIAFAQFDDTDVETYSLYVYGDAGTDYQYPSKIDLKYPKPGTKNPKVTLKLRNLDAPEDEQEWITLIPPDSVSDDHILKSVTWLNNNEVLATWMNRRQNLSSIQIYGLKGSRTEAITLKEPHGWVKASTPICFGTGIYCYMLNWIGNWMQIWKLDIDRGENVWKAALGEFTVLKILGYNEVTGDIFYEATVEGDSLQSHCYKNGECLTCNMKDEDNIPCILGWVTLSKNFSYYGATCIGPGPPYAQLFRTNSKEPLKMWEDNKKPREEANKFLSPTIKYLRVPVEGGYQADVKLLLPPGLDFNSTQVDKKYPMVVYVYGGPNSVKVTLSDSFGWHTYLTTSRRVIYCYIDGRGSGNKGRDMLYEINNRLGSVEIDDTLAVTKYLKDTYLFIDPDRVGIWGWSYGGYVAALSLGKDKDRIFQCGISVAPVTSWIYYDTIYTERFMGLPTEEDNLKNYEAGDVTKYIDNFKNHDFMLIHGSADDNVHYQQSLMLAKALQNASIMFEQVIYTDQAHGLSTVQPHLYHSMDQFWTNCLNLDIEEE